MVVEHLDNPKKQFKDIHRILKINGLFIFHTPNSYSYGVVISKLLPESVKSTLIWKLDRRTESNSFKTYYLANSEYRLKRIAKDVGFLQHEFRLFIEPFVRFARYPAIAFFELIYLRLLTTDLFKKFRTNIVCILKKPSEKGY